MKKQHEDGFSIIEIGVIIVVIAVIGVLGWKFYDAKVNKSAVSNVNQTTSTADMVPEALADLANLDDIKKSAIADKSGVTVVHIELEQSGDQLLYKAELSDGTVTVYNARSGARISSKAVAEKTSEVLPANVTTSITFARALEVAKAEKPGSKVYKIELELEGGIVVYSVRFTDKARVDVDAQTGAIVRTKAAKVETNSTKSADAAPESSSSNTSGKSSTSSAGASNSGSGSSTSGSSSSGHSGSSTDDSAEHELSDSDDDDAVDSTDDDSGHHGGDDASSTDNSGSGSRH